MCIYEYMELSANLNSGVRWSINIPLDVTAAISSEVKVLPEAKKSP